MRGVVNLARRYRDRLEHPDYEPIPEDVWEYTVPEIIAWRARQQPGALAVTDGTRAITYAALDAAANRLAHALLEMFPNPSDRVPLILGRQAILVVGMLAGMKGGREYAALESSFPLSQLKEILAALGAPAVVADSRHIALAEQLQLPILNLDDVLVDARFPEDTPAVPLTVEGNYSIAFTSGSTGASKGVASSKTGRIYAARRQIELMQLGTYDRYAHLGNPNFAGPQIIISSLLAAGAAIHLLDVSARGVAGLGQWIDEHGITIFHPATGIFRQCSPQMSAARLDMLRLVRTGADKRVRSDFELFQQYYPTHCQFQIGFGTSETGSVASMFFQPEDEIEGDQLPAGYVSAPEEVYILGEDGRSLPPNHEGEIVVYTPQLSSGYLNNESLTSDRFTQHPLDSSRRVYRTGDLGWLADDGLLYVAGRKDFQVKLRGMNVNMEEVSAALLMHPQLREAAVATHTDAQGSKRLVGYVVSGDSRPTVAALREFLGQSLAPFKIPSYFIFLDGLPKLPNGKVDYRSLPAPDGGRPALSTDFVAPGTPLEKTLATIWEETLGLRPLGAEDDFHELGGDSLQAAGIFVEVEKLLKKTLPPAVLYSAPTVRALAQRLEQDEASRAGEDGVWLVPIQRGKRARPFLFFVTPVRGDAMAYQHIIRNLSPDLTIYGLNTWTLSVRQQKQTTLNEMAARCVSLVLSTDPEGPYVLGGHSFAGILSYEIAHQLRRAGKEVKFIWMGDTYGPGTYGAPKGRPGRLRREVAAMLPRQRLRFVLDRLFHPARYLKRLRTALAKRSGLSFLLPDPLEIGGTGFKGKYIPPKQDLRVVMFLASGRRPIPGDDGSMGWNNVVTNGVEVVPVSGSHLSMLHDRGAEEIAAGLMAALNSKGDLH